MGFRVQGGNKAQDAERTDPNPSGAKPRIPLPNLGILNGALSDPEITEIMVNDLRNIAIEKNGQVIVTPIRFKSLDELQAVVDTLLQPTGRSLSREHPLAMVTLGDGSRVHVAGPPITDYGPCITIRKFPKRLTTQDFLKLDSLSPELLHFLSGCVQGRQNILISGGTGTGKTTLLNLFLGLVPPHERVITIEDTAEILYMLPNQVKMMTIPAISGQTPVSARDLVANALRMRPDRIIIGECRGPEALDMIQAMNTGHQGSMSTIHANSPRDALLRLETLMMSAGLDLPLPAVRRQIAGAIQVVVQIRRFRSGARKIVSVQEVTGMEQDTILLQEIFSFVTPNPTDHQSERGTFQYHLSSVVAENLRHQGIKATP